MARYLSILFILVLAFTKPGAYGQSRPKKDVYIYFKEDKAAGIYKEQRGAGMAKGYGIYWYLQKNPHCWRELVARASNLCYMTCQIN